MLTRDGEYYDVVWENPDPKNLKPAPMTYAIGGRDSVYCTGVEIYASDDSDFNISINPIHSRGGVSNNIKIKIPNQVIACSDMATVFLRVLDNMEYSSNTPALSNYLDDATDTAMNIINSLGVSKDFNELSAGDFLAKYKGVGVVAYYIAKAYKKGVDI